MVSAMHTPLTVSIVAIAMLASPVALGQAPANNGHVGTSETSAKPSEPANGSGDSALPSLPVATAPTNQALSNLAGGGYADPFGTQQWDRECRHRLASQCASLPSFIRRRIIGKADLQTRGDTGIDRRQDRQSDASWMARLSAGACSRRSDIS
jgi:hypothetical protein